MTDSQWDSAGRLSAWATVADSAGGRPLSGRSLLVGATDPESTRARAGAAGGQVDPLLNMAGWIGTNWANAKPASFRGQGAHELRNLRDMCKPDEAVRGIRRER